MTEAGPPSSKGVSRVVATDEATPMIENAKEMVWRMADVSRQRAETQREGRDGPIGW